MSARVAVVGAGPVGLTAALVLARRGVPVTVLEAGSALGTASRASTFHPATLDLLAGLGLGEEFLRLGRIVPSLQWRDRDLALLAELDYAALAGHTAHPFRLHAEQTRLTPLLLRALNRLPGTEVRWSSPVAAVRTRAGGVELSGPGLAPVGADYVIAADGAHSLVRAVLGLPFDGHEYPSYALRVILRTELDRLVPGLSPMTYVRDADLSCSLLGLPDHWRVILRLPHTVDRDEAVARGPVDALLRRALPTLAGRLVVQTAHTYRTARRVIGRYRHGRVLFAGDAAHLTSTAGGMNMNCGIHDAVELATAVAGVVTGALDPGVLDEAADRRRTVVTEQIIPRSEARVSGVDGRDRTALAGAVRELVAVAADPERARTYLAKASMLDSVPRMKFPA